MTSVVERAGSNIKIFWARLWADSLGYSFNLTTTQCKMCFWSHDGGAMTFMLHPKAKAMFSPKSEEPLFFEDWT